MIRIDIYLVPFIVVVCCILVIALFIYLQVKDSSLIKQYNELRERISDIKDEDDYSECVVALEIFSSECFNNRHHSEWIDSLRNDLHRQHRLIKLCLH